jgi:outer membrane receptor protein involved in Fe transport
MFNRKLLGASALISVALLAVMPSGAFAQGVNPASGEIEEVNVTARLRNESASETPAVVTALSADQLEQQGVVSMQSLANAVPNVSVTSYFITDAIYIRGVGNNGLQAGFEQQAGLFIDGVYYGNGNWVNNGMVDMATAEVLEGPQGAYFGKNTIAGAFNIHTADPTDHFTASIKAGYEFEAAEKYVNAMVSGPIANGLTARLAVYSTAMDGWAQNLTGHAEPGTSNTVARATLLWKPTEDFDANLKTQISAFHDNGIWESGILLRCGGPNNTPTPLLRFGSAGSAPCELNKTIALPSDSTFLGTSRDSEPTYSNSLNIHWRQAYGELTSITGWNRFDYSSFDAQDLGSINTVAGFNQNRGEQFSQELRYQTKLDLPVNFLAGAYYQSSAYINDTYSDVFPVALQGANYTFEKNAYQHGYTKSVFGEVQWKILDTLELDASDRFTDETKSAHWIEGSVAPYAPAQAAYGPAGAVVNAKALEFFNNSPQGILTWKPTADIMAYAAYKTGYLSGGFNLTAQATPRTIPATLTFGDEKVKGEEVGVKFWAFDRKLELNLDAYTYTYQGLQESIFNPALITYVVANAAQSVDKGVEASGTARLGHGFTLSGSVDLNDSHFTNYIGQCASGLVAGVGACTVRVGTVFEENYNGVHTSMAPLWAGSLRLNYGTALTDDINLRAGIGARYSDTYIVDDILKQPTYTTIDANVALDQGPWNAALIGRNLTDHLSCGVASPEPLIASGNEVRCLLNRGREVRLEVGYTF